MDSKKSNKITDIVRLQRLLKKWKNHAKANASKQTTNTTTASNNNGSAGKCINKFLKRTLSFTDIVSSSSSSSSQKDTVPKGFLAVDCVSASERKRFVIPTEYLGHRAFGDLLREAEEEFGLQQEGVLKIPCEVAVFEKILKVVQGKVTSLDEDVMLLHELGFDVIESHEMMSSSSSTSPDCEHLTHSHHTQTCR